MRMHAKIAEGEKAMVQRSMKGVREMPVAAQCSTGTGLAVAMHQGLSVYAL